MDYAQRYRQQQARLASHARALTEAYRVLGSSPEGQLVLDHLFYRFVANYGNIKDLLSPDEREQWEDHGADVQWLTMLQDGARRVVVWLLREIAEAPQRQEDDV